MSNVRKHYRLGIPIAAAVVAAAAVGGPALANSGSSASSATASKSAHAAKTIRGPRGPRGRTGKTGRQGPAGPQGPSGTTGPAGANGTSGTAGGGGSEGTILYSAVKPATPPVSTVPNAPPPAAPNPTLTTVYAGHGLLFTATCENVGSGPGKLSLAFSATTQGNAINVDGTSTPNFSATNAAGTKIADMILSALPEGSTHNVTYASTDGAVVHLQFASSLAQVGADCFVFGTRVGG
jgi:hypothetical protein